MSNSVHPLRRWREENGVTLTELAEQAGLSQPHLSLVERDFKGISMEAAYRLSNITGLRLEDFIREPA